MTPEDYISYKLKVPDDKIKETVDDLCVLLNVNLLVDNVNRLKDERGSLKEQIKDLEAELYEKNNQADCS